MWPVIPSKFEISKSVRTCVIKSNNTHEYAPTCANAPVFSLLSLPSISGIKRLASKTAYINNDLMILSNAVEMVYV